MHASVINPVEFARSHSYHSAVPGWLRWTIHSTLWFREGYIRNWWVYAIVLVGLFLFAILHEGVAAYKTWLEKRAQAIKSAQHAARYAPAGYTPMQGETGAMGSDEAVYGVSGSGMDMGSSWYSSFNWAANKDDWAAAIMHLFSWLFTYMLILAVITGNIGFIVAILLGHMYGKLLNIRRPMFSGGSAIAPLPPTYTG